MAVSTYSKSRAAASLGISPEELKKRAKEAGFSSTEEYWNNIGGDSAPVRQSIIREIVRLDEQLQTLVGPVSLSDEEIQAFLDKAVEEITPYYERKKAEIDKGVQEGKVRTAEEILTTIRDIEDETRTALAKFDLQTAQTEEEFINRLADVTATRDEDVTLKREDYRQRMENLKVQQVKSGMLTSGVGAKERGELSTEEQMVTDVINRRAQAEQTTLETAKKYDLEAVKLARKSAEESRIKRVGSPEEVSALQAKAREALGLGTGEGLPSDVSRYAREKERGVTPIYNPAEKLSDLEEKRLGDVESTSLELQQDELARREQTNLAMIEKIKAQQGTKRAKLATYGVSY